MAQNNKIIIMALVLLVLVCGSASAVGQYTDASGVSVIADTSSRCDYVFSGIDHCYCRTSMDIRVIGNTSSIIPTALGGMRSVPWLSYNREDIVYEFDSHDYNLSIPYCINGAENKFSDMLPGGPVHFEWDFNGLAIQKNDNGLIGGVVVNHNNCDAIIAFLDKAESIFSRELSSSGEAIREICAYIDAPEYYTGCDLGTMSDLKTTLTKSNENLPALEFYSERTTQPFYEYFKDESLHVTFGNACVADEPFVSWFNVFHEPKWQCYLSSSGINDILLKELFVTPGQADSDVSSYSCIPSGGDYRYWAKYNESIDKYKTVLTSEFDGILNYSANGVVQLGADGYTSGHYGYSSVTVQSMGTFEFPNDVNTNWNGAINTLVSQGLCGDHLQLGYWFPTPENQNPGRLGGADYEGKLPGPSEMQYDFYVACIVTGCQIPQIDFSGFQAAMSLLEERFPFSYVKWLKDFFESIANIENADESFHLVLASWCVIDIPRSFSNEMRNLIYIVFFIIIVWFIIKKYFLRG